MANSSDTSPTMSRFSGNEMDIFGATFDPNYTAEISNKMRVPKKICMMGQEGEKGDSDEMNGNWNGSGGRSSDKVQMQVPDRIIVTGREQHKGSKSMPRELQLETVVMPPDPEIIRIQTPPRSITLLNAPPPRADSDSYGSNDEDETLIVENDRARFQRDRDTIPNGSTMMAYRGEDASVSIARRGKRDTYGVQNYSRSDGNDEIEHLREQLSRMNRRLLAVEEDTSERKEKERYVVMAGLIYFAYKAVTWLFKSGPQH